MKLYTEVPECNPELHHQTEQYECTDEEFNALFIRNKPSILIRLYRIFCFFFFLGPIKIFFTCFSLFVIYIILSILPLFRGFFKTQRHFKAWAQAMIKPLIRLTMLSMGIVKINFKGKPHPDIRTYVGNHLSLIETVVMMYEFPVSYLAASYLQKNAFIKGVARCFDFVFVNRSSNGANHISKMIQDVQNDPYHLPVLSFPEGKVTSGHACIGFRTGSFISETPIQPFTIRFRQWLCPKSMATVSWIIDPFWKWAIQAYCIPWFTLDVDMLAPIMVKGDSHTPAERAKEAQLAICNNLGIYAYSKTNKDFFAKNKIQ